MTKVELHALTVAMIGASSCSSQISSPQPSDERADHGFTKLALVLLPLTAIAHTRSSSAKSSSAHEKTTHAPVRARFETPGVGNIELGMIATVFLLCCSATRSSGEPARFDELSREHLDRTIEVLRPS